MPATPQQNRSQIPPSKKCDLTRGTWKKDTANAQEED